MAFLEKMAQCYFLTSYASSTKLLFTQTSTTLLLKWRNVTFYLEVPFLAYFSPISRRISFFNGH